MDPSRLTKKELDVMQGRVEYVESLMSATLEQTIRNMDLTTPEVMAIASLFMWRVAKVLEISGHLEPKGVTWARDVQKLVAPKMTEAYDMLTVLAPGSEKVN